MEISNRISWLQDVKGLSDIDLASLSGLSLPTIINAKSGKNITMKNAIAIAKALNEAFSSVWGVNEMTQEEDAA
jgi:transcriptional regulator with XRE-family HTH domain